MDEENNKHTRIDLKTLRIQLNKVLTCRLGKLSIVARSVWNRLKQAYPEQDRISAIEDITKAFQHIEPQKAIRILFASILLVYVLTGIFIVSPGEQAVIKRLGRILDNPAYEGIHYRLPWPIDNVEKVNAAEVRRADVGVSLPDHFHKDDPPQSLQLLTGDENIISTEAIVHYKIKDAVNFFYNVNANDEQLIRASVETALVYLTASMRVDDILTSGKIKAQEMVMKKAQTILDSYQSGLQITNFNIKAIVPPAEVSNAFRDVTTAKEDKEKEINQARGYSSSLIPEARGRASEQIAKATSYKTETANKAKGDAQRFEAILFEYQNTPRTASQDTTKYRLFLETMEKVLPKVKKYVVDPADGKINLRLFEQASTPTSN